MQITIDPARLSTLKLWILVPAANDKIHATFSSCLIKLLGTLRQHGVWYELRYLPADSLVTRARNNLASTFMSASSDDNLHLSLWLDCDLLFEPDSILQMLALDHDFLAAPYSKKGFHVDRMKAAVALGWDNDKIMKVVGTPNVNWLVNPVSVVDPHPVLESGSGFWLVKRKVFRMMQEAWGEDYTELIDGKSYYRTGIKFRRNPEEAFYGSDGYDYFRVGVWPDTREYLSEDWWFCRAWRSLGGTVEECFWIKTHHIGVHAYPMDMPVIAELLNATGGFINGPTLPKENSDAQMAQAGSTGSTGRESGGNGENGSGRRAGIATDIARALAFIRRETSETAIPSDTGTMGWGVSIEGAIGRTLPHATSGQGVGVAGPDALQLHNCWDYLK